MAEKKCSTCGAVKPIDAFGKASDRWRRNNPEKVLGMNLRRAHGISLDEYRDMLAAQGGKCAICGGDEEVKKRLVVDHDHGSGEVRGLLCSHCNLVLGYSRDNPAALWKAAAYLEIKEPQSGQAEGR